MKVITELAAELEEYLKAAFRKQVTVQCATNKTDMVVNIGNSVPIKHDEFSTLRLKALSLGYDLEEEIDEKMYQDNPEVPEIMYFYILKLQSDSKSK